MKQAHPTSLEKEEEVKIHYVGVDLRPELNKIQFIELGKKVVKIEKDGLGNRTRYLYDNGSWRVVQLESTTTGKASRSQSEWTSEQEYISYHYDSKDRIIQKTEYCVNEDTGESVLYGTTDFTYENGEIKTETETLHFTRDGKPHMVKRVTHVYLNGEVRIKVIELPGDGFVIINTKLNGEWQKFFVEGKRE